MKSLQLFMMSLILLLIGCATFATGKYDISDIQKGNYLSNAEEVMVDFFFKGRMENCGWCDVSPFSDQRRWNILYEDNDFVYFGYVLPKYPTKHDISTGKFDRFYKVAIDKLNNQFPQYKTIQGHHIWDKTKTIRYAEMNRIRAKKISVRTAKIKENYCNPLEESMEFDLLEEHIKAVYTLYCLKGIINPKRDRELARYKFLFDKHTLDLIDTQKEF